MKTNDQNLAALETSVANLKPAGSFRAELSVLCHTFGVETEEDAIELAIALAKHHYCEFRPNREHGYGYFQRDAAL